MSKKGQGMGAIGGALFTIGAILAIIGYSWGNKKALYAGIGLAILGAISFKLIKV